MTYHSSSAAFGVPSCGDVEKAQAEGRIGNVTPEMENRWEKWIESEFRHIDFLCEEDTQHMYRQEGQSYFNSFHKDLQTCV